MSDHQPLRGCRVLLTRPAGRDASWRASLESAGAVVLSHPTIAVAPPASWAPLDAAFERLDRYDWVLFTSAAAVELATLRWPVSHPPAQLERPQIAAIGPATRAALQARGFAVALVPDDHRQEGLLATWSSLPPGTSILFPQAEGGREALATELASRGITVDVVPASRTLPLRDLPEPPPFDVAVFASPSAFEAFVGNHGIAPLAGRTAIAIGPTTAGALRAAGVDVQTATGPSVSDVIATIVAAHQPSGKRAG